MADLPGAQLFYVINWGQLELKWNKPSEYKGFFNILLAPRGADLL